MERTSPKTPKASIRSILKVSNLCPILKFYALDKKTSHTLQNLCTETNFLESELKISKASKSYKEYTKRPEGQKFSYYDCLTYEENESDEEEYDWSKEKFEELLKSSDSPMCIDIYSPTPRREFYSIKFDYGAGDSDNMKTLYFKSPKTDLEAVLCVEKYLSSPASEKYHKKMAEESTHVKHTPETIKGHYLGDYIFLESLYVKYKISGKQLKIWCGS